MKNSPIGCRFTRKIPSLGDEKFLLGHNPVTENSSAPPGGWYPLPIKLRWYPHAIKLLQKCVIFNEAINMHYRVPTEQHFYAWEPHCGCRL